MKPQFSVRLCAVSQVEIDQVLVRKARMVGKTLKIFNRFVVESNGDLPFELASVWILDAVTEVI